MRALIIGALLAMVGGALTGCPARTDGSDLADIKVGDCLKLGGTPGRPQATKAACGSQESNFKVVALVKDAEKTNCPADVDSSYLLHNAANGSQTALCLDIDWVIGGCMSVDPQHTSDPLRVDCDNAAAPHRQRATHILTELDPPVSVDQCPSGLGYTYAQRRFAVCVENVGNGPRG